MEEMPEIVITIDRAEHDAAILQLMEEIEMRTGDNAARWEMLREILETKPDVIE